MPKTKRKMKSNDGAILRLIELPAIIGKVERGSGLEGKITSSALASFVTGVGRSPK